MQYLRWPRSNHGKKEIEIHETSARVTWTWPQLMRRSLHGSYTAVAPDAMSSMEYWGVKQTPRHNSGAGESQAALVHNNDTS
jgi:hypothetical protein